MSMRPRAFRQVTAATLLLGAAIGAQAANLGFLSDTPISYMKQRDVDSVKVLRFQDRQVFDERTVREVADQIAAALPNDGSPIRVVLDFTDVGLISSSLLSKLILLQRRYYREDIDA